MKSFSEWRKLQEVGTSTACVASFNRIAIPGPVRRKLLGPWADEDPFFKKKKHENLDSVKELIKKKFADWLHGRRRLDENMPLAANSSVAQTLPDQNQPILTTPVANQQGNLPPLATLGAKNRPLAKPLQPAQKPQIGGETMAVGANPAMQPTVLTRN